MVDRPHGWLACCRRRRMPVRIDGRTSTKVGAESYPRPFAPAARREHKRRVLRRPLESLAKAVLIGRDRDDERRGFSDFTLRPTKRQSSVQPVRPFREQSCSEKMMSSPIRILLQTTISPIDDDWNISRFSLLRNYLADLTDEAGAPLCDVAARDRTRPGAPDPILSTIDRSDYDQLWLFAVDTGDGLDPLDCEAIGRFRASGRGLLVARDHMDLGCSVTTLAGIGAAHFFHTRHLDPDTSRHVVDDRETGSILWPNYHSGANGDYQEIVVVDPPHPVLRDPVSPGGLVRYLPAHPHEGAVGARADDPVARVIAMGTSKASGRPFNIAVAFEPTAGEGPAIAESTFHHFCDYNWDPAMGCPSFVTEVPGNALQHSPEAQRSIRCYVRNLALWLAGRAVVGAQAMRLDQELDEALDESFPASDPSTVF
ncbi:hypothetical protein [Sphingosinicella sp. BN140058]|uniref:hypothetical protein n=1 Tax=Sphingosinicella sp. BN140058 TaxID=1892855 RepID=UPI00197E40DD|nr:hypothetical protein [Sphingosinicella sp. BN140058]